MVVHVRYVKIPDVVPAALATPPPPPPDNAVDDARVVPGLGVGKYGNDDGPLVRYTPFESTTILSFPLTGDGGVSSRNGSPDSPKRRKYTEILQCIRGVKIRYRLLHLRFFSNLCKR